ncbi:MAG: phage tail tip lysozyme [Halanaerobiales bacterium]
MQHIYIYNKLTDEGWTKESICALLGNIQQESQMNPGVWQRQGNTNKFFKYL